MKPRNTPREGSVDSTPVKKSSRSRAVGALVVAIGVSIAGIYEYGKSSTEKASPELSAEQIPSTTKAPVKTAQEVDSSAVPSRDISYGKAPRLEVDSSIEIPTFTHLQTSMSFQKPKNLEMDDKEFLEFSKTMGGMIKQGYEEALVPSLRLTDRNARDGAISDFMTQVAAMLATIDPRSAKEMEEFHKTWTMDPYALADHFNAYLKPGGWYLAFHVDTNEGMSLEMFPIQDSTSMRIENGANAFQIPVITLRKSLSPRSSHQGEVARVDNFFKEAVVFGERSSEVANRVRNMRPPLPNFQQGSEDLAETQRTIYHDFLIHESGHAWVAKQFPKTGAMTDQDKAFRVPLVLLGDEGNQGLRIDLSGVYPAAAFQELCGVGIQMARGMNKIPDNNVMFFESENPARQGLDPYILVHKLVPIATLQAAPDSPQKRAMMEEFMTKGNINFDKLKLLVGTPPYSIEHTKKAGELLYRFGYALFQKAERGELELVKIGQ